MSKLNRYGFLEVAIKPQNSLLLVHCPELLSEADSSSCDESKRAWSIDAVKGESSGDERDAEILEIPVAPLPRGMSSRDIVIKFLSNKLLDQAEAGIEGDSNGIVKKLMAIHNSHHPECLIESYDIWLAARVHLIEPERSLADGGALALSGAFFEDAGQ